MSFWETIKLFYWRPAVQASDVRRDIPMEEYLRLKDQWIAQGGSPTEKVPDHLLDEWQNRINFLQYW